MGYNSEGPVAFDGGVSMVTASLGANDPELGSRKTTAGNEYVFVYNDGLAVGVGQICAVQSGSSGYSVTGSSVVGVDPAFGVCVNSGIANAEYGWVLTRGFCKVEPASAAVSGMMLAAGTNGQATDPIAGASTGVTGFVFARACEQTVACGAAMCYVNCF
jgi:hypothetical protein